MFTHLHTPVGLNRYPGKLDDVDPCYNETCSTAIVGEAKNLTACVGRNVLAHLDFGVLPYLYDGLWPNPQNMPSPRRNIMQFLFPITPRRIGPGFVEADERLVTKHSGPVDIAGATAASELHVSLFDSDGLLVSQHSQHGSVATLAVPREGAAVVVSNAVTNMRRLKSDEVAARSQVKGWWQWGGRRRRCGCGCADDCTPFQVDGAHTSRP